MLCRYERTIFKSDKGFCIFAYSTSDESVPKEARNRSYYHDDKIHFTAIGYRKSDHNPYRLKRMRELPEVHSHKNPAHDRSSG